MSFETLVLENDIYAAVLNSVPAGISITVDPSCADLRHNPVAAEFLRIQPWDRLSHSSANPPSFKMLDKGREIAPEEMPIQLAAWQDKEVRDYELECVWEDGVRKTALWNASPLKDDQGKIIGAVATFKDITEQKRTDKRIRRQNELLQRQASLLDLSMEAILAWDLNGAITYWNKGAEKMYGFSREEAVGRVSRDLLKTVHPIRIDDLKSTLLKDRTWSGEIEHTSKDGRKLIIETRHQVIQDESGNMTVLETNRDITGRKRAEMELSAARNRLATELAFMNRLHRISTLFLIDVEISGMLGEIVDAAIAITGADMGNIQLLDRESGRLKIMAHRGFEQPFLDFFNAVEEGRAACGTALHQKKRVIIDDVTQSPIFVGAPALQVLLDAGVRAVQSTPLLNRSGNIIGMLSTHYRSPRLPDERDFQLMDLLARRAADIIEHIQTKTALQESLAKLEAAFACMTDAVFISDLEGNFIDYNDAFAAYHRFKDKAECLKTLAEYPDILDVFMANGELAPLDQWAVPRALRGETVSNAEYGLRRKDTGETWVGSYNFAPIRDQEGTIVGSVVTARDITEQKRAEKALRESEERFRAFVTASSDVVYSMSPDWMEMRHLEGREFIPDTDGPDRTWIDKYIHPDDQQHVLDVINEAIRTKSIFELEHRVLRVDGTLGWTFSRAVPLLDAKGEIVEWFGTASDVTARKDAEQALQESEALLQAISDNTPDPLYLKDRDCRLLLANPATLRAIGKPAQEVIGKTDTEFYDDASIGSAINEDDRRIMESGETSIVEEVIQTPQGLRIFVSTKTPWRDAQGRVIGLIGVSHDITERKRQNELLQRQASLLNLSTEAIFAWDLNGAITYWNKGAEKMYGFSSEEAVGCISHYLLRTEQHIDLDQLKSALARDGAWSGEIEHTCKDGRKLIIETRHQVICDQSGNMTVLETNRDITKRKRAEEEIRSLNEGLEQRVLERTEELSALNEELNILNEETSVVNEELRAANEELTVNSIELEEEIVRRKEIELELQAANQKVTNILESISDSFIALDREWRLTYLNAEARRQLRIKEESEAIGKVIWDVFPNYSELTYEMYHKAISEPIPVRFEVHSQVSGRWQDIHAYPSTDGLSVYFLDITERKKAEDALLRSEERFAKAFHSGPTIGVIRSLDDDRILDVNDNFLKTLEYERDEVVGQTPMELGLWTDREAFEQAFRELESKGELKGLEVDQRTKSGKIIKTLFYAFIIEINGEPCALVSFVDITERKRMEQKIAEALELNQTILESSPIGISTFDSSGQLVFINDAGARITGGTKELALQQNHNFNQYDGWKNTGLLDIARQVLATGISGNSQLYVKTIFGKEIWMDCRFIRFISGGEPHLLMMYEDITERKRMEEELRSSENQLRLITDNVPAMINSVDSQQRYKFVNKACEDFYGYKREDVLGKYVCEVVKKVNYQKALPYIEAALSGEKAYYEIERSNKDGEKHYFYNEMVPEIDDQGTVKGYILLSTDMTRFKAMEQKIAEALEFNQTILESSPIGISTFDSSGQLLFINDAGLKIGGGTKELALQHNINFNKLEAWKQAGLLGVARQVLSTGLSDNSQTYVKTAFGKELWMDYRFSRFITGGEPNLLVMYEDITERKLAEEQIIKLNSDLTGRAHELTKINKELESFSYSISHDLRAPLRAMNGFSQMIFDKYQGKLDDEGKEYLQIIRSECNRMSDLINGLLSLSRLSRKELKREDMDLSVMAETIAAELQRSEPERQVEFAITPEIKAYGDKVLLQSVLQNLLDNAWKFTSKHEKARIEFGSTEQEGQNAYFIRDDGAGFDMRYADKLFGTFQRIHGVDEFPGNGIGLAIIQRIIHHHGGKVWAEGEIEKGATFYFTLNEQPE